MPSGQLICWIKSNLPEQSRKLTEVYISITRLTLPQTTLFIPPSIRLLVADARTARASFGA